MEGFPNSPITLHRYVYAGSDPINRIDPSGKSWLLNLTITAGIILRLAVHHTADIKYFEDFYADSAEWLPDAWLVGVSGFAAIHLPGVAEFIGDHIGINLDIPVPIETWAGYMVGLDLLFSYSSAQIAAFWYHGPQLEGGVVEGNKLPIDIHVTAYQGWIWNLWNADNYAGPFIGLSGGGSHNIGVSLFCDGKNHLLGPHGIAFPFFSGSLSTILPGFFRAKYTLGLNYSLWRDPIKVWNKKSSYDIDEWVLSAQIGIALLSALTQNSFSLGASVLGVGLSGWIAQSKIAWNRRHPEYDVNIRQTFPRESYPHFQSGLGKWMLLL